MKKKVIMGFIILILLAILGFKIHENQVNIDTTSLNEDKTTSQSVINNTSDKLRSHDNSADTLVELFSKISFKYEVLKAFDEETQFDEQLASISEKLETDKKLIQTETDLYNSIYDSLEAIDNQINVLFYSHGVEMVDGSIPSKTVTITSIDDTKITCTQESDTFVFDTKNVLNKTQLNIGDTITIYYSKLTFENNIGQILVFYVQK